MAQGGETIHLFKMKRNVLLYLFSLIFSCSNSTKKEDNIYLIQYFDEYYSHELIIFDSSGTNRLFDFRNNRSYLIKPLVNDLPNDLYYFKAEGKGVTLKKLDKELYSLDINKRSDIKIDGRFDGCIKAVVPKEANLFLKYVEYKDGTKDTLIYRKRIIGTIGDYCFQL